MRQKIPVYRNPKMRVYELKLAKMTKKMAKIRPGVTERPYGLRPKKTAKIDDFRSVLREKKRFSINT